MGTEPTTTIRDKMPEWPEASHREAVVGPFYGLHTPSASVQPPFSQNSAGYELRHDGQSTSYDNYHSNLLDDPSQLPVSLFQLLQIIDETTGFPLALGQSLAQYSLIASPTHIVSESEIENRFPVQERPSDLSRRTSAISSWPESVLQERGSAVARPASEHGAGPAVTSHAPCPLSTVYCPHLLGSI